MNFVHLKNKNKINKFQLLLYQNILPERHKIYNKLILKNLIIYFNLSVANFLKMRLYLENQIY